MSRSARRARSVEARRRRLRTEKLTAKLRLRDGESHLLAGLLQDEDRRSLTGISRHHHAPGAEAAVLGINDSIIAQTDIVMLLTPRIIRTHEYTAQDLSPIYLGTNQNFGLTGPPPLDRGARGRCTRAGAPRPPATPPRRTCRRRVFPSTPTAAGRLQAPDASGTLKPR